MASTPAAKISSAVSAVIPAPPAQQVLHNAPPRAPADVADHQDLHGRPGRGFRAAHLPRVLDGPGLPENGDLDLPRILQVALDLLRQVARQGGGRQVVNLRRLDQDTDLAAGLNGE